MTGETYGADSPNLPEHWSECQF